MTKMRVHAAVGDAFLAGAGPGSRLSHVFPVPVERVWDALLSSDLLCRWLPIDAAHWTSPLGPGATRTARFGTRIAEERFFAWDDGRRMAFRFERSTLPVRALAEDYRLEPRDTGCVLHWTGRVAALPGLAMLINRELAGGVRRGLVRLEAILRDETGA